MQEITKNNHLSSTSELFENLANNHARDKISIGEIKSAMHERGFGVLFIIFSLPLLIPIPVPTGLGTAMSLPIFFFAYQLTVNVDSPWLPKWILRKELSISMFRKVVSKALPILRFVEKLLKERLPGISNSRRYEIFTGIFILLLNIPIMLPFPLSNTLPAAAIIVIAFGMIEKDGLMMLLGKLLGLFSWLVCILIGIAIFYGANEATKYVPESFRDDFKKLKQDIEPQIQEYKQYIDNDENYEYYKSSIVKKNEPPSKAQ